MSIGKLIDLFHLGLGKGQGFARQKLLLAVIILVKINFTFGERGLEEVRHFAK
jgi:hypothetical protein